MKTPYTQTNQDDFLKADEKFTTLVQRGMKVSRKKIEKARERDLVGT